VSCLSVCLDCGCDTRGTVGWSRDCHVVSGQCQCRPFVNSRRCDECVDGAYNLQQHNAFGCQRTVFTRESSYCFQRVLAIAILSVCLSVRHTGGSVKNGAS